MSQNKKTATKEEIENFMVKPNLKIPKAHEKIMSNQALMSGNIGLTHTALTEALQMISYLIERVRIIEANFVYVFDNLVEKGIIPDPPKPKKVEEKKVDKKEETYDESLDRQWKEVKDGKSQS